MVRNIITFELRKGKDDDIVRNLAKVVTVENSQSSIIREALRNYLGGQHKERVPRHIVEQSIDGIVLQEAEKDDAQLDYALDNLLNF